MIFRKPFPGFWQAVLLLLAVVGLMIFTCIILGIFAALTNQPELANNPLVNAVISIFSMAPVIVMGFVLTGRKPREVFFLKPVSPLLFPAMALTVLGMLPLLSELDNVIRIDIAPQMGSLPNSRS